MIFGVLDAPCSPFLGAVKKAEIKSSAAKPLLWGVFVHQKPNKPATAPPAGIASHNKPGRAVQVATITTAKQHYAGIAAKRRRSDASPSDAAAEPGPHAGDLPMMVTGRRRTSLLNGPAPLSRSLLPNSSIVC